jgi:CHAD domain-containing protein
MKKTLLVLGTIAVLAIALFRFEFVEKVAAQTKDAPAVRPAAQTKDAPPVERPAAQRMRAAQEKNDAPIANVRLAQQQAKTDQQSQAMELRLAMQNLRQIVEDARAESNPITRKLNAAVQNLQAALGAMGSSPRATESVRPAVQQAQAEQRAEAARNLRLAMQNLRQLVEEAKAEGNPITRKLNVAVQNVQKAIGGVHGAKDAPAMVKPAAQKDAPAVRPAVERAKAAQAKDVPVRPAVKRTEQ